MAGDDPTLGSVPLVLPEDALQLSRADVVVIDHTHRIVNTKLGDPSPPARKVIIWPPESGRSGSQDGEFDESYAWPTVRSRMRVIGILARAVGYPGFSPVWENDREHALV